MSASRLATLALASGALSLPVACGDVVADPGGEPPPPLPASSDASAVFPRELPPSCPSRRPLVNSPCDAVGSTCEYGTSPDMQCNRTFACVSDVFGNLWVERPKGECQARACPAPATTLTLDGQPCEIPTVDASAPSDADEMLCPMTDGICACTTGPDGPRAHERRWVCVRPATAECSVRRPLAGQPCNGALWCDYGSCKTKRGLLMQCIDGVWLTGGAPCN